MLKVLNKTFDINPIDAYFTLDINETQLAAFKSIQGGDVEVEVVRHNIVYESGEYRTLLIPGATRFSPITLGKGFGNTTELYNWFVAVSNGQAGSARKNVTIHLNSHQKGKFTPMVSWNLINAIPTKVSGFQSDQAQAAGVAMFSITLVAESIERVDP
jgi:phage tail-like protein